MHFYKFPYEFYNLFKLADPTLPGQFKLLSFLLVDPTTPILSTSWVPPQQRSWYMEELYSIFMGGDGPRHLPAELVDHVGSFLTNQGTPMAISLDEAKKRKESMLLKTFSNYKRYLYSVKNKTTRKMYAFKYGYLGSF